MSRTVLHRVLTAQHGQILKELHLDFAHTAWLTSPPVALVRMVAPHLLVFTLCAGIDDHILNLFTRLVLDSLPAFATVGLNFRWVINRLSILTDLQRANFAYEYLEGSIIGGDGPTFHLLSGDHSCKPLRAAKLWDCKWDRPFRASHWDINYHTCSCWYRSVILTCN